MLLLLLSGCASRGYGGEQTSQTNSSGAIASDDSKQDLTPILLEVPKPKVTTVSGAVIHESENKQSVFINKLLARILHEASLNPPPDLSIAAVKQAHIPAMERPVEGFSSSIGNEDYIRRAAEEFARSGGRSLGRGKDPLEGPQGEQEKAWAELQQCWQSLANSSSQGEFREPAKLLQEYLAPLANGSAVQGSLSFSAFITNNIFSDLGYWNRPEGFRMSAAGSGKGRELRSLSVGERVLARNRALILVQLGSSRSKSSDNALIGLRATIQDLATADNQEKLLWARTHVLLQPEKKGGIVSLLGKLSVIGYSFAQISEVTETGFRLRIVSYQFAYAQPAWDKAMTEDIIEQLCQDLPHRALSSQKECDAVQSALSKLSSPALSQMAARKRIRPLELRGYSPALITDEKIVFASLQGTALGLQAQLVERFAE